VNAEGFRDRTESGLRGDEGAAERYAEWAEKRIDEGNWAQALAGLERGADFSNASSDISYLLARARLHEGKPRGAALEAIRRGLALNRWRRYSQDSGKLLEAHILTELRQYEAVLEGLSSVKRSAGEAHLRLSALKGLGREEEFLDAMADALDRYPEDPVFPSALFSYGLEARSALPDGILPGRAAELIALAVWRLPLLTEADPELAWRAVPFIEDEENGRRLLEAYRSVNPPVPASLPVTLRLGLIGEEAAVEEFFAPGAFRNAGTSASVPDRTLFTDLYGLLSTDAAKALFRQRFLHYTGVITGDTNRDGIPEVRVRYRDGLILDYSFDADQDGIADIDIFFSGGHPARMLIVTAGETGTAGDLSEKNRVPPGGEEPRKAEIIWEQFPAAAETRLDGVRYVHRPRDFFYTPVLLEEFLPGFSLYPELDPLLKLLSPEDLGYFSVYLERPSREFPGGIERIELKQGIPQRAVELAGGRPAAETEFREGRPVLQRIDTDLDGRMETERRFREDTEGILPREEERDDLFNYKKSFESTQSDWDGDGIFETGEDYFYSASGERTIRSWDMDKDGNREYTWGEPADIFNR
jgi:tetratricopeptide (TPR) repeat protein